MNVHEIRSTIASVYIEHKMALYGEIMEIKTRE